MMFMNTKKRGDRRARHRSDRLLMKARSYLVFLYGVFCCQICFADSATDPLATSVKPQVQALFGTGSTVAYCIYIAEIILGSVVYIKSKNLLTLVGVPVLVLFTHAMFSYISS